MILQKPIPIVDRCGAVPADWNESTWGRLWLSSPHRSASVRIYMQQCGLVRIYMQQCGLVRIDAGADDIDGAPAGAPSGEILAV